MLQPSVPAWFEIPARDLDRAVSFWESVLDARFQRETMGPMEMAVFPYEKPHPSGAVVRAQGYEPTTEGTVLYLNVGDVAQVLPRVAAAGGEVLLPAQRLPDEMGTFAQIRDSEGNRVGLFSRT